MDATTFTSTPYRIVTDPQHYMLEEKSYNLKIPNYYLKDNTLYMRIGVWQRDFRLWLESFGITVNDENKSIYHPIIKVENGVVTTWETSQANMGNKFLQMEDSVIQTYYPNLYFVQVGMHPYPREARFNVNWQVEQAQRESHRIIYPHHDPKQYFILPKDIDF